MANETGLVMRVSTNQTSGSITNISGKSGSCEIKWVDEAKGSSTSSTTGGAVTNEELDWLGLWVIWAKSLLVEIFACEVKSLSWEISDDVSEVTSPESHDTLLSHYSAEAITNTIVLHFLRDVRVGILDLEQKLNSLDWGDNGLRDSSGDTTRKEVSNE